MLLQAVYSAKFFVSNYTSPNSAFNIDVQVNIFLSLIQHDLPGQHGSNIKAQSPVR